MHKVLVRLVAILAAAIPVAPTLAQQVASVEVSRIVIAPPQTELARTIKAGLSAAYYGARPDTAAHAEAQRLYFLYGERHFEPIWLTEDSAGKVVFSPAAAKIITLFENAEAEGLDPSDYLTPSIARDKLAGDGIALATLETAFSAATMRYANHLHNGRIDPQSISRLLDITPKPIDEAALLEQLAGSNDPAAILARLEPKHPEFLALKAALATFEHRLTRAQVELRHAQSRAMTTCAVLGEYRCRLNRKVTRRCQRRK